MQRAQLGIALHESDNIRHLLAAFQMEARLAVVADGHAPLVHSLPPRLRPSTFLCEWMRSFRAIESVQIQTASGSDAGKTSPTVKRLCSG